MKAPIGDNSAAGGPSRPLLIVGHSHVACIQAAMKRRSAPPNVRVINLRSDIGLSTPHPSNSEILQKLIDLTRDFEPRTVCLMLGGNYHNVLGLIDNPIPFSIGEERMGVVPQGGADRQFIPYALMKALFDYHFNNELAELIYDAFPAARRMFLNAPPPIPDDIHIRSTAGPYRADMDRYGICPNDLRIQLYRIQEVVLREGAEACGARFVDVRPDLFDDDGFLARAYFGGDPAHGNVDYGASMLQETLSQMDTA